MVKQSENSQWRWHTYKYISPMSSLFSFVFKIQALLSIWNADYASFTVFPWLSWPGVLTVLNATAGTVGDVFQHAVIRLDPMYDTSEDKWLQ